MRGRRSPDCAILKQPATQKSQRRNALREEEQCKRQRDGERPSEVCEEEEAQCVWESRVLESKVERKARARPCRTSKAVAGRKYGFFALHRGKTLESFKLGVKVHLHFKGLLEPILKRTETSGKMLAMPVVIII